MAISLSETDFKLVAETYFQDRGFHVERITELRKAKRPDYKIARIPRRLAYFGELKAPELHLNKETGIYMHLTKIRKLRQSFVKKAAEQFSAVDPAHINPRILIFTASHFQFHGKNLIEALLGYIPDLADFRSDSIVQETWPYIFKIDLFIWLQVSTSSKSAYRATLIKNSHSKFLTEINDIVNELNTLALSAMDQIFEI